MKFRVGDIVTYSDSFYSKDKKDIYGIVIGFANYYTSVIEIKIKWIRNKVLINVNLNDVYYYPEEIMKIG